MFGIREAMRRSSNNILVQAEGFWDRFLLLCDVVWTVYTQKLLDEECHSGVIAIKYSRGNCRGGMKV